MIDYLIVRQGKEVLLMASHLLRALDCLHRNGLVHRDVCLNNLLWVKDGDQIRYKLTDFGLCCSTKTEAPYMVVCKPVVYCFLLLVGC